VKTAKLTAVGDRNAPASALRFEAWRTPLARVVCVVHACVVAFFMVGWALPWRGALWLCAVGAVAMRVQWWMNDDVCVLTQLERRLRGEATKPRDGESFIGRLVRAVIDRRLPASVVDRATHATLFAGAGIAAARLLFG
jgi:hypothetical protein